MHVAAIGIEIENRVADQLTGPVVGHIAAASGLEHLDAARRQLLRRGDDVGSAVLLDADGHDMRMLKQQEGVGNSAGLAILDQRALQLEPLRIRNEPEPTHLERERSPERAGLVAKR